MNTNKNATMASEGTDNLEEVCSDLWNTGGEWTSSSFISVPRMAYAKDPAIIGQIEFQHVEYDPAIGDYREGEKTCYLLNNETLPIQKSESDDWILQDATVSLTRNDGTLNITISPTMEANKGHVWFIVPKVIIERVTGVVEQDWGNIKYSDEDVLNVMDIHYPESVLAGTGTTAKAVITIHGGSWSGGEREYYSHMTPYITGQGLIHVNMDYRLIKNLSDTGNNGDDSEDAENNDAPYVQMLDDIQMAIKFLKTNATAYRIDTSAIGLMGYSAGGHLAMLYAFSRDKGEGSEKTIPVKLVISEAGPTDFDMLFKDEYSDIDKVEQLRYNVFGILAKSENITADDMAEISPLKQAENNTISNELKTALFYGCGVAFDIKTPELEGDGIVPYSNATDLENALNGENNGSCQLVELHGTKHGDFCPSLDESGKVYLPLVLTSDSSITYVNALNNSLGYLKNYVLQNA